MAYDKGQWGLNIRRDPLGEIVASAWKPNGDANMTVGLEVTAAAGDTLLVRTIEPGGSGGSWPVLAGSFLDIYRIVDETGAVIASPAYAECDFHQEGDLLVIDAAPTSTDFTVAVNGFYLQVNITTSGRYLFAGGLLKDA